MALEDAGGRAAPEPSLHISTYYDSPDFKLRRQSLSFCIREQHGDRVHSLIGNGAANDDVLRGEWHDLAVGERPKPAGAETGAGLLALADDELRPMFTTEMRRTVFKLDIDPSAEIGAALDEGVIYYPADGATQYVCELELELKSGNAAVLYDMALRLLDAAPLRIETRSQPDRGYSLTGAAIQTIDARPFAIDPSMTVDTVLQGIGRECLGHLLHNESAALAGEARAFHQMRVALRRLRTVLSGVKAMLPAEPYRWMQGELKWLAESLGPTREWDVFATELLAPVQSALPDEGQLTQLEAAAKARRQAAYERAKEAIESRRYIESLLRIARWFESGGWRDQPASERSAPLFGPIAEIAPQLMERRWRQVRKLGAHFAKLSQDERHRLRIALKQLRYMTEFLGVLFDADDVKIFMKRLKPLQEELGHFNDVQTAQKLIGEMALADGGGEAGRNAGLVLGWHMRGVSDQEARLRKRVRRLRKTKPFWQSA